MAGLYQEQTAKVPDKRKHHAQTFISHSHREFITRQ